MIFFDRNDDPAKIGKLRNVMNYFYNALVTWKQLTKDSISLVMRRREGFKRLIISVSAAGGFAYLVGSGAHDMDSFYLRKAFDWESSDEFNEWYPQVLK